MSWPCGWRGWQGSDAAAVRRGLDADPAGFALTARQAALAQAQGRRRSAEPGGGTQPAAVDQRLLLVVDQFEQLFTQCPDEEQRRAFITALHAAATARHGPDTNLRPWSCSACALILRPAAPTTRSWPRRSRTAIWSRR